MKKLKLFVSFVAFALILGVNINSKAYNQIDDGKTSPMKDDGSMFLVDKRGYDDWSGNYTYYSPKITYDNENLDYNVTGDLHIGHYINNDVLTMDTEMKAKINIKSDKIYEGKNIHISFYIIDAANNLSPGVEEGKKKLDELISYDKNYIMINKDKSTTNFVKEGTWHVKYDVDIGLVKNTTKAQEIKIGIKTDRTKHNGRDISENAYVIIVIPPVKSVQENINTNFTYKGFIKDDNANKLKIENGTHKFGTTGTIEQKAQTFINSYKMKDKKKLGDLNQTPKFSEIEKGIQFATVGFNFTVAEDFKMYYRDLTYTDGKVDWVTWNQKGKEFKKGKKYSVVYQFAYCNGAMLYSVGWDTEDSETLLKAAENEEKEIKDTASEIVRQYKLIIAAVEGERRKEFEFSDVLSDTDYYTNVGDIDPNSSAKVEEKISTVITVITNIGIIFSVLMPAVIGIKYMLGSVEEKAEYKKDMIPYLVGAGLLFGVCTLVKILQTIGNSINSI